MTSLRTSTPPTKTGAYYAWRTESASPIIVTVGKRLNGELLCTFNGDEIDVESFALWQRINTGMLMPRYLPHDKPEPDEP